MTELFGFRLKKEKYLFWSITIFVLVVFSGITLYPSIKAEIDNKLLGAAVIQENDNLNLQESKTSKEYYAMFQCSCCGEPIDAGCCGMAKQRKEYLDNLLVEGLEENEIVYQMVKKFGFDVLMDQSKEQEIRDYIKSKAPENPPQIELEKTKYDFGTISQSDGVVSTMFLIKNSGGSDLVIENLDTSCMCTTASLIYDGKEGPIFGMSMHGENPENYELIIPPRDTAQLKVYYDPNAHGKQEKPEIRIIREVTIISNDPVDFQKKVRIELTQVP